MQVQFFSSGFVVHKIQLDNTKGHFSAWYNNDGHLLDCEQLINGTSREVPASNQIIRQAIACIGKDIRPASNPTTLL